MVDGLDSDADDVRHPGDYIEEEMVPYIDRATSGENVYSQDIIDTTWGPIFTACYPVSANHDGTGAVSYTHLDVYKRQILSKAGCQRADF